MSPYPQRKSPRLQGYDYSHAGAYFVTLCQQQRLPLFGQIEHDVLTLNSTGDMLCWWWERLPKKYESLELDHFVVMPNHFHGIIVLNGGQPNLSDAMGWFKTMTTNAYIRGVKEQGWIPFEKRLWQRSFHDHIIRDERGLNTIRNYVLTNPARWNEDTFYSSSL